MSLMTSAGKGAWLGSLMGGAIATADLLLGGGAGGFMFTNIAHPWMALLPNLFLGSLTGAIITASVFTIGHTVGSVLGLTGSTPSPAPSVQQTAQGRGKGQAQSNGIDKRTANAERIREQYRTAYDREETWEKDYFERQQEQGMSR